MGGWKYPFEQWVLDGWAAHSAEVGGPAIAAKFRENLRNPKAAREAAKVRSAKVEIVTHRANHGIASLKALKQRQMAFAMKAPRGLA